MNVLCEQHTLITNIDAFYGVATHATSTRRMTIGHLVTSNRGGSFTQYSKSSPKRSPCVRWNSLRTQRRGIQWSVNFEYESLDSGNVDRSVRVFIAQLLQIEKWACMLSREMFTLLSVENLSEAVNAFRQIHKDFANTYFFTFMLLSFVTESPSKL